MDERKAHFLIRHLCELLAEVLSLPRTPADAVVGSYFRDRGYLGSRDRGFLADHLYDGLRRTLRLRFLSDELLKEYPDHEAEIVLTGALIESADELAVRDLVCEALDMHDDIYDRIAATIAAAAELINALPEPDRSAMYHGLPVWFTEKIIAQYHSDAQSLLASLNEQAPITLRTNRLRTTPERLMESLRAQDIPCHAGAHAPDAIILGRRMNANAIPEFKDGAFELQDEGSQLLSVLLDPHPNWRVFDACAGAGGKTLHLTAIMRGRGELVAHDTNFRKLREIKPRIVRSGAQNIRVMEHEAYQQHREKLAGAFNAVMIDAPCTGTGALRRNPGARLTLDIEFLERLQDLQAQILEEYAPLVRSGGLLLYATCSLLHEENQMQVEKFLARHPEFSLTDKGYFRCDPFHQGTDGFFAATLLLR